MIYIVANRAFVEILSSILLYTNANLFHPKNLLNSLVDYNMLSFQFQEIDPAIGNINITCIQELCQKRTELLHVEHVQEQ